MQSSMGDRLKGAAVAPTRPLDLARARRRGLAQRAVAVALATISVASVVTVAAVAYPRIRDSFDGERSSPATGACEPEVPARLSVFLRDDVTEGELQAIRDYLAKAPLSSVAFVTKREAYEEFKEVYADKPEFWANLPEDALPASFRIEVVSGESGDDVRQNVSQLPGVDNVRGPPRLLPGCMPSSVAICGPVETSRIEAVVSPAENETVRHFGVALAVTVPPGPGGCARTIYVELDGVPMAPPDGVGPDANEFSTAASARDACVPVNLVAGDFLYEGHHVVGIGTGCDPSSPGPYPTQRTIAFDGDQYQHGPPSQDDTPRDFCDHARFLDELRRAPTDDELDDLLRLAPDEIDDDTSSLVESARAFRDGDESLSQTDEVQEAADRFDRFIAEEC